ncbi:MAG: T9SS type A sorting domain-containing protein [Ignavibacteriae bacterium]|nr:T9SS type A sorting domain-containing protein [Ignavibacteriota bacterium]MCB9242859.1 T9SS type A sorting domain-containing protein [Ignavibacteriales bacterium]
MKKILLLFILLIPFTNIYAQWYWTNPFPQGNSINTFKIISGKFVSVGECGTVQMTTDRGVTWQFSNTVADLRFDITALSCYDQNTYYAATYGNGGFFIKSTNAGLNWSVISTDIYPNGLSSRAIQFLDTDNGFLLSRYSLFTTSNGGINWSPPRSVNSIIEVRDLHFFNKDTGLVCGGDVLFPGASLIRTTNGGINWTVIITSLGLVNNMQFINSDTGFAFHDYLTYLTTDRGLTWDTLGNPDSLVGGYGHFFDYSTGYVMGKSLYFTTNSGANWTEKEYSIFHPLEMHFDNVNTGYITGSNNIISTSNGGLNWSNISGPTGNGTASTRLLSACFIDQNTGFVVGWTGALLKTTNSGENWNNVNTLTSTIYNHIADVDFINSSTGYCVRGNSWNGDLLKTTNGGNNWFVADSIAIPSGSLQSIKFVNQTLGYTVDNDGNIFRTTDSGNNWSLHMNLGNIELDNIIFADENTGFLSGYVHPYMASIYKTTNSGQNWALISNLDNQYILSLYAVDQNTVYAAGRGLLKSTNGGINWTQKLPGTLATTIFQNTYFSSDSVGYLAGTGIIYKSTNFGENWYPLYVPTNNYLYDIHFFNDNTGIIVGENATILKTTNGGGNFTSGINQISSQIPDGFSLHQNYPNPFNPSTNIAFDIAKNGFVQLKIYDITGREVSTLVNQDLKPGSYSYCWNPENLSSGIYFYILKTGSFISTRKMTFLK